MDSIEKTKKFTDLARKMYEFDKDNPTAEMDWLTILLSFSNGVCGISSRRCPSSFRKKSAPSNPT